MIHTEQEFQHHAFLLHLCGCMALSSRELETVQPFYSVGLIDTLHCSAITADIWFTLRLQMGGK